MRPNAVDTTYSQLVAGHPADDLHGVAQPGSLDDLVLRAVHRGLGAGARRGRDVVERAPARGVVPDPSLRWTAVGMVWWGWR